MFSEEFLARFDALIRFQPLQEEHAYRILQSYLSALAARLSERGITLLTDHCVLPFLCQKAPKNRGARGYQHTAAQYAESLISGAMLDGSLGFGDTAALTVVDGALILKTE